MRYGLNIASSTTTVSDSAMLLSVVRDEDGSWIVSDHATMTYGHGPSLLHALCDYHAALLSTLCVLDEKPLTERLARQLRTIRWLLDREVTVG